MSSPFRRMFFSARALSGSSLPDHLVAVAGDLAEAVHPDANQDLIVAHATEILLGGVGSLPDWYGIESKVLVVMDVPEPAVLKLPTLLGVRKPDQRMHITRDATIVRRVVLATLRDDPRATILDAYVIDRFLVVICGDFTLREFPRERLPGVRQMSEAAFADFELDRSGSYLFWPEGDVHLGPSQMLQAVDPMYLADVEIRRYAMDKVSSALQAMRESRGLIQAGIPGLSERQVRRLEKEESRLTTEAALKYAEAFGQPMSEFLAELSRTITGLRDEGALTAAERARTPVARKSSPRAFRNR